ncbi:MAG: hypothetical protein QM216_00460 [Bacillota bacterium]|nr:hypothetical protein [Bacillota bacterium]
MTRIAACISEYLLLIEKDRAWDGEHGFDMVIPEKMTGKALHVISYK